MALYWNFDTDRIGTLYILENEKEFVHPIYSGNAFAIFTSEWEEDNNKMYSLYNFFSDEEQAKKCLGLSKEYKDANIFSDKKTRWELKTEKKNAKKLATMLLKSGIKTTITII